MGLKALTVGTTTEMIEHRQCFRRYGFAGEECIMKVRFFLLVILLTIPALVFSQNPKPKRTQIAWQTHPQEHQVTITGCLTKNSHDEYELVDQKGVHNLVYKSERVDLESHVGQSVSLTGKQSAMPGTDTGTSRPMPHFVVKKLRPASGNCGK